MVKEINKNLRKNNYSKYFLETIFITVEDFEWVYRQNIENQSRVLLKINLEFLVEESEITPDRLVFLIKFIKKVLNALDASGNLDIDPSYTFKNEKFPELFYFRKNYYNRLSHKAKIIAEELALKSERRELIFSHARKNLKKENEDYLFKILNWDLRIREKKSK